MTATRPQQPTTRYRVVHTWIPLADGVRLAARIWLPEAALTAPVPAVLEYLPYRYSDGTAARDDGVHPYFAGHGYAGVRVDIRGSGNSEGGFTDEYSPQEHADALGVIAWIADQPWCDGRLGMMGISWGGFNSLQVAALRPPALRAIITVCSTDDRYRTDCHYQGGTVIGDDMLPWGTSLTSIVAAPALHGTAGGARIRVERWKARLDALEPPAHTWLRHQTLDAYWRRGSVNQDFGAIEAATLVVGGWADGYRNAAVRLAQNLTCPRRAIIGPWAHRYPHDALPGPTIDFLAECVRWWDHWLGGRDSGVMDEPLLRAWVHDWDRPTPRHTTRRGRWVGLDAWDRAPLRTRHLDGRTLRTGTTTNDPVTVNCRQDTGLESGAWCAYGVPGDFPPDQRLVDAAWVTFDDDPLVEPFEAFGFPRLRLRVASDAAVANLCVRLCDVAPDGTSLLVSQGVLNLTHRGGDERPQPMEPGVVYDVAVTLDALAHRFARGHRIRLAVSNAYFPRVWPAPGPTTLTIHPGPDSVLTVPTLAGATDLTAPASAPPTSVALVAARIEPPRHDRVVLRRFGDGADDAEQAELLVTSDGGTQVLGPSALLSIRGTDRYRIRPGDPRSADVECRRSYTVGTRGERFRVDVVARMSADADWFHVQTDLRAYLDDVEIHRRLWEESIARQLV